jgi:DNA-binding NtrC family response regulator
LWDSALHLPAIAEATQQGYDFEWMSRTPARGQTLALEIASLIPDGTAWVVVQSGDGAGRPVVIGADPLVVGSDPTCGIVIDDPHVSRKHAEISRTGEGVLLRDLGSRNGTFVGRIAVKEVTLTSGAEIRLGTTLMRFELGGEQGRLGRLARAPIRDEEIAHVPGRFGRAVGSSAAMRRLFALLARLAPTELTLTLIGETGTGKDVLARAVHDASRRADEPFVVFDCGAVAPSLIESELFGHEKGAFTGAVGDRRGAFERAHGGTLFLDEIGELSIDLQPKLLRALEQRSVRRVGGSDDLRVDVRIVAATNRDLEEQVRKRVFREDLFFRLMAAIVHVPPLRERKEDLPELVGLFVTDAGKQLDLSPDTLEVLRSYDWPGNVRELRNVIASAMALADGPTLEPRHFAVFRPQRRQGAPTPTPNPDSSQITATGQTLEQMERAAIEQALQQAGGNRTKAARALGIASSTLYEKIRRYGLNREPG